MNLERIKKYFTEKPKTDFWKKAFFYSIILHYITPLTILFLLFFQIGLVAPGVEIGEVAGISSENLANAFTTIMETLYSAGERIATDNPLAAKILFFALSSFVWVVYIGVLFIIIDLIRYAISYCIRKGEKKK